jgi:hypothetical protein
MYNDQIRVIGLFITSETYHFFVLRNSYSSQWVQVAYACNPSYSGGRDKED